jgi:adenine phosphoribosyltransferase
MDFFQCWKDVAFIRLYDLKNDIFYTQLENCGTVPNGEEEGDQNEMSLMEQVLAKDNLVYGHFDGKHQIIGSRITFGQLYHQKYPKVPSNDWTGDVDDRTRKESLVCGLFSCMVDMFENRKLLEDVESKFRFYQGFPKPGVNFLSWDDIFLDPKLMSDFYQYIAHKYVGPDEAHIPMNRDKPVVDLVIGLESRGFLLSAPVAQALGVGQIFMRKAGKIAGRKVSRSYKKEYGSDTFELRDDLEPKRVILIDDVLATGGSLEAAANLARLAGHTVVDCIVVRDVPELREVALQKLKGIPYRVIL